MFCNLESVLVSALLFAGASAGNPSKRVCRKDRCRVAARSHLSECSAFLQTTVTPCPAIHLVSWTVTGPVSDRTSTLTIDETLTTITTIHSTVTSYISTTRTVSTTDATDTTLISTSTISSPTTSIPISTKTETITTETSAFSTRTETTKTTSTDFISTISVSAPTGKPFFKRSPGAEHPSTCSSTTSYPTQLPSCVSDQCFNAAAFSSACFRNGIHPSTATLPQQVITLTTTLTVPGPTDILTQTAETIDATTDFTRISLTTNVQSSTITQTIHQTSTTSVVSTQYVTASTQFTVTESATATDLVTTTATSTDETIVSATAVCFQAFNLISLNGPNINTYLAGDIPAAAAYSTAPINLDSVNPQSVIFELNKTPYYQGNQFAWYTYYKGGAVRGATNDTVNYLAASGSGFLECEINTAATLPATSPKGVVGTLVCYIYSNLIQFQQCGTSVALQAILPPSTNSSCVDLSIGLVPTEPYCM